jgi:hypothetical protein
MPVDEMFDILPQDAAWGHEMAHDADGLELHYVRRGQGSPTVLLLHGWPVPTWVAMSVFFKPCFRSVMICS